MREEHTPDEITQRREKGGGGKYSGGGRNQSESLADFNRIGWPTSIALGGRLAAESAISLEQAFGITSDHKKEAGSYTSLETMINRVHRYRWLFGLRNGEAVSAVYPVKSGFGYI